MEDQNDDILNLICQNENIVFNIQIYLKNDILYILYKNKNDKYYQQKLFEFNELTIISSFFSIFNNINEIFESMKDIISNSKLYNKNPNIIKEENELYFIIYPNIGKYKFIKFPLNSKSEIKIAIINDNFLNQIEEDIKIFDSFVDLYEQKIKNLNHKNDELKLEIENYKKILLNNYCIYYNVNNSFNYYIIIKSEYKSINLKDLLIIDDKLNIYKFIISFFTNKKLNFILIYKAKNDGDRAQNFHNKVDGKGPLIILVKTSKNIIIGGYTSIPWSSSDNSIEDSDAFLFSLKNKKIYKILKQKPACIHSKWDGPFFGFYGDLKIVDGCFKNDSMTNCQQNSYNFNKENLIGEKKISTFLVKDYEVYQVICNN